MQLKDFTYELPQELIAQRPLKERDECRLLVMDKATGQIEHKIFSDILNYLNEGDCLVLNDTRVLPARLMGEKIGTGGKMEFLLLKRIQSDENDLNDLNHSEDIWEILVKPGKKAKIGSKFIFGNGELKAEIIDYSDDGGRIAKFQFDGYFEEVLDKLGSTPLPPYIKEKLPEKDKEYYQTVYSKNEGSAAAPTAGLHFTKELLKKIEDKGISLAYITLHVGLGTFRPVKVDNIEDHHMHSEYYIINKETSEIINRTKKNGGKVIAVGTTSTRTLETVAKEDGRIDESSGWTDIFIFPGYKFKIVDGLITNFHLPESTLLMLVSALSTKDNILKAYETAVNEKYRFFSFGDAMFIK